MLYIWKMLPERKRWRFAALLFVCILIFAASAFWRGQRALEESSEAVSREGRIAFTFSPLRRVVPADAALPAVPAQYSDSVLFGGRLYLAGPAGLFVQDRDRAPIHYRTGFELPPAPLTSLALLHETLYAGTAGEGVLTFDGTAFRHIRAEDSRYRDVTALLPSSSGRVLIGTAGSGVLAWDGSLLTQFHPALQNFHVTSLAGSETDLWVGTVGKGVLHWNAGQAATHANLPDPHVLSLAVGNGAAFAGTALGIAEFRDGRLYRTLANGIFAKALYVQGDSLLAGTLDDGLYEIPLKGGRPRHIALDSSVQRLHENFVLAEDGIYDRSGARLLDTADASLSDRNIAALSVDSAGRVWVGYFDRGLDILSPEGRRIEHLEDSHLFCVNRVTHDETRALHVVATANGLVLLDAGLRKRQVLTRSDGLMATHITDVAVTPDGLTLATPAGLTLIDRSGPHGLYAFHGLVNNHVYAVAHSGSSLLAGTLGGASLLESGVVKANYTTANSPLRHNWISAIVAVGDEFFAGTYGAGVFRLNAARTWTGFHDLQGQIEVNPNAMAVSERYVFAGTLGKGLLIHDRETRRWRTVLDGLPSLNVTAVAVRGGTVYIGTDNGLVRRSEDAL